MQSAINRKALAIHDLAREFCQEETASVAAFVGNRLMQHYLDDDRIPDEEKKGCLLELQTLTGFLSKLEKLTA